MKIQDLEAPYGAISKTVGDLHLIGYVSLLFVFWLFSIILYISMDM